MTRQALLSVVIAVALVPARGLIAADWPMWRCDARRSGATAESLPETLSLQWVRHLPPPRPAWPNEPRLGFDASYEPVILGKTLFVGSPNDGSVRAFETDTGRERWRFHTAGPVRFAPVAWRGKVYVGSDDGFVYCLDAASGKRLWKLRGAPDDRADRWHLGNGRLISYWPVRGGCVLAGETLYFAAGFWPTLGVFVVAAEARSGRVLWRNAEANYLADVRLDHNDVQDSGLSPQGYLAVAGPRLLVPNGRSMPAALDAETGRVLYYVQGYRNGHWRLAVSEPFAFVGPAGVIDVRTGREVGSRWASAGKDAPRRFDIRRFHLFEGPIHPYKFVPGCSSGSVVSGGIAYGLDRGTFHAYDLRHVTIREYDKKNGEHLLKPWRWDPARQWQFTPKADKSYGEGAMIRAGRHLVGAAGKTLLAVALPTDGAKPTCTWRHRLDDRAVGLAAADGKLFAVTAGGAIHCFAAAQRKARVYPLVPPARPTTHAPSARLAAEILARSKVADGYGLVLGLGNGRLVEELLAKSDLHVIAVDPDAGKVAALRERLTAAGLFGQRVEVFVGRGESFGFPPYLASLIVSSERSPASPHWPPAERLLETLRPYGGTAYLSGPGDGSGAYASRFARRGGPQAHVERVAGALLLRRAGALAGSAPWTHECADAARSFFSPDQRVRGTLGVLWYGDGVDHGFWKRKDYGVGVKPQVIGGRLFALQLSGRTLVAYDVYTGRQLWTAKVEEFTRYASMADGIYVAGGSRCRVHDPATGQVKATYPYETQSGEAVFVADLRVLKDVIVIAVSPSKTRAIDKGLWDSKVLVALDRRTGQVLWRREARERFNNNALAGGDGMVFCVDSRSPAQQSDTARRGSEPATAESILWTLDARTGHPRWSDKRSHDHKTYGPSGWMRVRGQDDSLAYSARHGVLLVGKNGLARAFDARSGKVLWERRVGGAQPWILRGETFLQQSGTSFDIRTGTPAGRPVNLRHGGCNYAVGGAHLVMVRDRSVCTVDPNDGTRQHLRNVRSGCSNSLIAADGLLNVPNFAVGCICNYPIQTSFALAPMPETAAWAGQKPVLMAQPSLRNAEDVLEPIRKRHNLPALAAGVLIDGRLAALGATGVRKAGTDVPVTRNDAFHIGSCTKAMTATLLAILVDQGKLRWQTTLADALGKAAPQMHPAYRKVTVRHLLSHRAGIVPNSPPGKSFGEFFHLPGTHVQQRLAYVRQILQAPPQAKPGEKYIYSNAGYAIAGAIAERVTGTPWQELMRKRIFEPLGMKTAGFGAMGTPGKIDQPWQHVLTDGKHQPIGPGQMSDNPVVIGPAGRVHCSMADWAKFVAAHLNGPKGRPCPLKLKTETWRMLHKPAFGGSYALGWVVAARDWGGGDVLTHAGSNTMNYAVVWMAPQRDFAVLVATNQGPKPAPKACDEAAATLIRQFLTHGK